MDLLQAIILGVTQGVTEFLPISSDGHLVVVDYLLPGGLDGRNALGFDILLHCGSLLAILIGFRDVWTMLLRGLWAREAAAWRTTLLLAVATVPAVFAGLFLQDLIAGELRTLTAAAVGFLVTAAFLVIGEYVGRWRSDRTGRMGILDALLVGLAQAAAVLPGVSRSGLTVSTGRALGINRESALDFSFLMAMPIIAGAVAKTGLDLRSGEVAFPSLPASAAGFAASFVVSCAAIVFLRRFVRRNSFAWFAWYLVPLALVLIGEDMGLRTHLDSEHARELVRSVGAAAVFAFAIIETVPPFSFVSPGVTALVIAGSIAPDPLSLGVFVLAAVAASVVGNVTLYCVGQFAGPSLVRALRLPEDARKRAEDFVRRAGVWAVIGGQFVGALRPTVAFAAGMLGMPLPRFLIAVAVGALLWGGSAVGIGYLLRGDIAIVASGIAVIGVLSLLVFAGGTFVQLRRNRSAPDAK